MARKRAIKWNIMIARISILILLLTLLPDLYIYRRYLRWRFDLTLWMRLLWWVPGAAMIACTAAYSMMRNFAPDNLTLFNVYLFMLGLLIVPKVVFTLSSLAGLAVKRLLKLRTNWGNHIGLVLVLGWFYVLFMGTMVGPDQLHVKRVTLEFDSLPKAFDGYRIVQLSDMHLGSMKQEFAQRMVAQVNELHPDAILFTGDLQNMRPQELVRHAPTLVHLHPVDGIFSVLGNHDYADYVKTATAEQKRSMERMTRSFEASLNWDLLLNERRILRRGADSIVIAGTENDGRPPFPCKADYRKALHGISPESFVIMMQHDPSAWRRHILPQCTAQLTLSGHTHGGQLSLFGWRPTSLVNSEDAGLYSEGKRFLFVSTGVGGFLPFRFHMKPEIVEITLKAPPNPPRRGGLN